MILKQSVGYTRVFLMVQASDHITGLASATVTVNISKAGAAFGAAAGSVSEIASGWYKVALTAFDTETVGDLAFDCTAASGDPCRWVDQVQANVFTDLNLDASGNVVIDSSVKKNQALGGFTFVMTDSSHNPVVGKTVTAQRSLGGAGFAPCANSVSEIGSGVYAINLAAGDLNANTVMLKFTSSGCSDLNILLLTQP